MRARCNIGGILSVSALALCTAACAITAAGRMSVSAYAARVGGLLYAPSTAIAASLELMQNERAVTPPPLAVPAAQTFDEDDYSSGFWAEPPKPAELTPMPPEPSPMPSGAMPIQEAHYEQGEGKVYIPCGNATIKNCTALPFDEVAAEVNKELPFAIEIGSAEPQVLLMHTHTTETYQISDEAWYDPAFTARSTDEAVNMIAVGEAMKAELDAAGIATLHDTTLHDYPSYNGAYARSNVTVRKYLQEHPSIKIVLDVHRDAIQRDDGTRIKPVAAPEGTACAQVMLICGADKGGNLPNFKQNLRFASAWQAQMANDYTGLARPVLFDYRYYNQDLSTGSLLIEVGGHANTLSEAKTAGVYAARALARLLANK